jgi:hypothetical protein
MDLGPSSPATASSAKRVSGRAGLVDFELARVDSNSSPFLAASNPYWFVALKREATGKGRVSR